VRALYNTGNAPRVVALLGLALIAGTGIAAASVGVAQAVQPPRNAAPVFDRKHVTEHGVPDDFIFAAGYTWLNLR